MKNFARIVQRYGEEIALAPGQTLFRQGSESDGLYYLREGRLGVYKERGGALHPLSTIAPGETVGELGAATGWRRTATVRAETASRVIHVSDADFRRALDESPSMAAAVVCQIGERLTDADAARLALSRSRERAAGRIEALCSETARLEELLRLREELADMIIHDLYNPLTVIGSGLQLLEHVPFPEDEADYAASVLETMRRSTRRMERLVDTLMDMARLEESGMTLELAPVALDALVDEVLEEERHLAESHGIELEQRLPAELPPIQGDREVLERVLINLVDNALKFTPSGGRVWVEAEMEEEGVRLAVVDTGPGVPPEDRERIFERFTQGQARAEERRGSGLGLAFCRMAVEAHDGRIWVSEGPEGVGSRFVVRLRVR
jgi:signal transduction histidine kinase